MAKPQLPRSVTWTCLGFKFKVHFFFAECFLSERGAGQVINCNYNFQVWDQLPNQSGFLVHVQMDWFWPRLTFKLLLPFFLAGLPIATSLWLRSIWYPCWVPSLRKLGWLVNQLLCSRGNLENLAFIGVIWQLLQVHWCHLATSPSSLVSFGNFSKFIQVSWCQVICHWLGSIDSSELQSSVQTDLTSVVNFESLRAPSINASWDSQSWM